MCVKGLFGGRKLKKVFYFTKYFFGTLLKSSNFLIFLSGQKLLSWEISGGFLYQRFVGCNSGNCPIQSVWYMSILWGAVLGYLLGDIVFDFVKRRRKSKEEKP